ncbi:MAG: hypothetical protein ACFFDN_27960, partial [Candidatus Hodarchaeota archaeon]
MSNKDQRTAVDMSFSLSNRLMAAALAMLTILAAFFAYVIGNREPGIVFFIIAAFTFIFFVGSIFIGGKGISKSYNAGYNGNWNLGIGKPWFKWQAILCLVGLCSFGSTLFFYGSIKETKIQEFRSQLKIEVENLQKQYENSLVNIEQQQIEIGRLRKDLRTLKDEIITLKSGKELTIKKKNKRK